ncbi:hypothetical protein CXF83_19120 [Shewanella sp. Choline-02u-19]|nr:hypothetical protein CXF84_20325 [Shewanella sp. Bg11-22]PKI28670.1 hypothetical protein CXF83_19120 [Shewanella sp. Choline-02u-19]
MEISHYSFSRTTSIGNGSHFVAVYAVNVHNLEQAALFLTQWLLKESPLFQPSALKLIRSGSY